MTMNKVLKITAATLALISVFSTFAFAIKGFKERRDALTRSKPVIVTAEAPADDSARVKTVEVELNHVAVEEKDEKTQTGTETRDIEKETVKAETTTAAPETTAKAVPETTTAAAPETTTKAASTTRTTKIVHETRVARGAAPVTTTEAAPETAEPETVISIVYVPAEETASEAPTASSAPSASSAKSASSAPSAKSASSAPSAKRASSAPAAQEVPEVIEEEAAPEIVEIQEVPEVEIVIG